MNKTNNSLDRSKGTWLQAVMIAAMAASAACVVDDLPELGEANQELDAARTRMVQESSYAMTGNHYTYTTSNWPTGTVYARAAYVGSDAGAWNLLLASPRYLYTTSTGVQKPGGYVSCMRYRSEGPLYGPCSLSTTGGYGSFEPYYTCQGYCPSVKMRGGQCKAFANLVAYRSGLYQGPNYSFKALPADSTIAARSTTDPDMPVATYANILEGDVLRRPYGHALIVVRKISPSQVVVFDSNWLDGDGSETVGSHVLGFSGSGNVNLGNYRVLKCVYTGAC